MLLLFSFWIITGLMAEGLAVIYQLKNSSVCLNVVNSPSYKSPKWAFDKEIIVEGEEINPNYTGKVVYNPVNHSLCINNLTDTDTGIYEFSFSHNFRPVSVKHQLIVQEMVPRPVIKMSNRGSNVSAGLCSITVNCSIQDEWLSLLCVEDSCTSQKAFSKVNITIVSNNRTVTCSGSNHVSTSNASKTIITCFSEQSTENKEEPPQHLGMAAFIIAVLCVPVLVLIFFFFVKRQVSKKCKSYQQQTSTVHSIQSQPMGTLPPSQPRLSTGSSSSDGDPAYENADIIQLSQTSSPAAGPREEMSSMDRHQVDTIYSFPDGNASSANNTQNTSEAAATVEEAQRPAQIDTVYSVLQKPKNLNPQRHQEVKQDL
ncbi:SLAM family member 9 [Archocentrus centrarchus]|uniref:SLAM family member 9 n=1 Tax=Archocentrus centrarchus TaxID=63155 RepID=UPI0011EA17EA|nr:SLAM family member 9-like [Archocentrus centrarchus]